MLWKNCGFKLGCVRRFRSELNGDFSLCLRIGDLVFLDILIQVLFLFLVCSLCPGEGGRLTGISVCTETVKSCSLSTCYSVRVVMSFVSSLKF